MLKVLKPRSTHLQLCSWMITQLTTIYTLEGEECLSKYFMSLSSYVSSWIDIN